MLLSYMSMCEYDEYVFVCIRKKQLQIIKLIFSIKIKQLYKNVKEKLIISKIKTNYK